MSLKQTKSESANTHEYAKRCGIPPSPQGDSPLQVESMGRLFFSSPHFNNPSGDFTSADFLTISSGKNDEWQFRLGSACAWRPNL
jgi:hypothetical protein